MRWMIIPVISFSMIVFVERGWIRMEMGSREVGWGMETEK
jgi:hypothetical protein